jgi:ActR/RegA family two-component response regulator
MSLTVVPGTTIVLVNASLPTVLAVELDNGYRDRLIGGLRKLGYIVLEARDSGEALDRVRIHSRHIHLLLIHGDANGRNLAATLKPYRPDMEVIYIRGNESGTGADILSPDLVLERAQGQVRATRAGA